jgi:hypothetical protein
MTSPLERAARALCLADGLDPDRKFKSSDWSEGTAPHEFAWHEYLPKARAVLTAIREPSGEMLGEVHDTLLYAVKGEELDTARTVWDRMIDMALEEK